MKTYPIKFEPIFKQRIWGGDKLQSYFAKQLPANEKIGESWELTDLPEDKSPVINGELAGMNVHEAINKYPKEIMGEDFSGDFPLLIKILDAQDDLSVQVHPTEETCKKLGKGNPKTECWYIIDVEPGAVIYKGLKQDVTKERFAKAIDTGTTANLLNKIKVKPGQMHFLPSGTVHAIGAGLLIAEIQLPSDTTYRVFDWNRADEYGKGRQLHIEESMESILFDQNPEELTVATNGRLVDCEFFTVDKGNNAKGTERLLSPGKMKIIMILGGCGVFVDSDDRSESYKAGDTILIPAAYQGAMTFSEETKYLIICTKK